ncbi:Calcium-transporting ATPase 10, plasma membrane-type [Allomyces javanicus]|nr:Calcium-transporting ATPase 10, plasma membrane-type [Allomyces javanicus]
MPPTVVRPPGAPPGPTSNPPPTSSSLVSPHTALPPIPPMDRPKWPSSPGGPVVATPPPNGVGDATRAPVVDEFLITPDQLGVVVNFDERSNPEQTKMLNAKYGGVDGIAHLLRTNLEVGLSIAPTAAGGSVSASASAAALPVATATPADASMDVVDTVLRQDTFGINVIPPPKSDTIFDIVWGTIKEDPIIKILIASAVVTLIIGFVQHEGWIEGLAILAAVLIVLTVTAGNDYSKDKKFKKLLLLQSDKKTKVLRGGRKDQISSWDVLVGDVVELVVGDEIPADGIFVRGNRLVVDESPLTGESVPVKKSPKLPFLFSGCQVSEGTGFMLVTAVGPRSSGGKIQTLLSEAQSEETVLQAKLREVAMLIGKVGFAAGIITFFGLSIRFAITMSQQYAGQTMPTSELAKLLGFFNVAVTVVVVAVPEGLPLAVTISLAFSMFKMIRDRCFVRHLDASETMGEATAICTDKTGTLTENRMTVVASMVGRSAVYGEGYDGAAGAPFSSKTYMPSLGSFLAEAVCINSTCFVKYVANDQLPKFVGSATEGALLVWADRLGYGYEPIRAAVRKVENGEYLFTSDRKRMSTLCEPQAAIAGQDPPPLFRLYTKGAPEMVLKLCTAQLASDASCVLPLGDDDRAQIALVIKDWASQGLRTIAIAFRDFERPLTRPERDDPERDLTFVGLVGIKDPVRSGVPEAVRTCQDAGIFVRMVTGDNILTACKIARECHILSDHGIAMEGPVFRALSDADKKAVIPKLQVLARSSPADKYVLVNLLKQMGEVVAVTGDGTNDAPALKEADVGFAMGISGTQISMNASDIILLDDNFISIVQSIKWGRNVLSAVRKFLQFQLSVNLVAVGITIVGSLTQDESPLNPVQLLWVNLIMDTFGALGLASDVPSADILKERPHSRHESILTPSMRQYIPIITVYQMIALLVLLFKGPALITFTVADHGIGKETVWIHTIIFTAFVLMQVVNEVLARQLDHELNIFAGFWANSLFPTMLTIILVIQVVAVQFAGVFMGTLPLNAYDWGICIATALLMVPWVLAFRGLIFLYRRRQRQRYNRVGDAAAMSLATVSASTASDAPSGKALPAKGTVAASAKVLRSAEVYSGTAPVAMTTRSPAQLGGSGGGGGAAV